MQEGLIKFDKEKVRMELLHPVALREIAKVFTHGAKKYAPWNFMLGTDWSRYYGACQRHLNAYWDREDKDKESGLLHLAHAGACLFIILIYQLKGIGKDDRPEN